MAEANGTQGKKQGKRPFFERWSYFFLITAAGWLQVIVAGFDVAQGNEISALAWFGVAFLIVAFPTFAWMRRREERKRLAVASD